MKPERVWIHQGDDRFPEDDTWSPVVQDGWPEYVRADLYAALLARAEAAEADLDAHISGEQEAKRLMEIADAERDAARAEAQRLREAHTELDAWARAEITRLRRLWTYMQEAASDIEADEPMTAAEWLAEFSAAEQATRAALAATEARDE